MRVREVTRAIRDVQSVPVVLMMHVLLLLKCCFTSTETVGLLETRAQDGHLDFHTATELCKSCASLLGYIVFYTLSCGVGCSHIPVKAN